ncbi:endonuclease/exonuclease/phosphatase family protein [Flavobacterium sp.]|uniref:endonuclease/exonuclease/phosphatase family protein n=1 Tax=Flavobacterium sp. TaxID=239 RepID=UPI00261ECCE9|nr:endonuclease/exonuclease/phosphatase family protein [Flavobacterium sp.]
MIVYYSLVLLVVILTILPLFNNQHWIFRLGDFLKVHVFYLTLILSSIGLVLYDQIDIVFHTLLLIIVLFHGITVLKYTRLYRLPIKTKSSDSSSTISILSANIYQYNKNYDKFQNLISKHNPDIFITLESNSDWEIANRVLEHNYPFSHKVTLENTYGMHLYSKFPLSGIKEHYFVADDIPSLEVHFHLKEGYHFVVFVVHPPPPSPTEEVNSKERDGELLSVALRLNEINKPTVVIGDLNNVGWAKSTSLFMKKGNLIDPRIGRGLISTFHAKYFFLRIPIDHIFHTAEIFVQSIKKLEAFGSDHFAIWAEFWIDHKNDIQEDEIIEIAEHEEQIINDYIKEGIEHEGNRD